jgi:hypothetical protein
MSDKWILYDKYGEKIGSLEKEPINPIGCLVICLAISIVGFFNSIFSYFFPASERLTKKSKIDFDGFGTVKIGMTIKQAEKAGQIKLVPLQNNQTKKKGCLYVKPLWFHGIKFMITNGHISRIDVHDNLYTKTVDSVGIDFPTSMLKSQYGKYAHTSFDKPKHKQYIEVISPKLKNHRIIFEANYLGVDRFRVGKLPEVKYKNGCN